MVKRERWFLAGVIFATMGFYLTLLPHWTNQLDPLTGDEPYYVMTSISLMRDGDLDESNNYRAVEVQTNAGTGTLYRFADELNPPEPLPANWNGWPTPLTLVPAHAATSDRQGLYSKHGLGLALLIAIPYAILGRIGADSVIILFAALLAGQMFLLARESGASMILASVLAAGLAIAMPIGPYALLIFPAIPAALLLMYAIRRSAAQENAWWQTLLAGTAIGFLPWLHQRFAPTALVLTIVVLWRLGFHFDLQRAVLWLTPIAIGGFSLLAYNQWLYGVPFQRVQDHAGFNGFDGTVNGAFGLLLDAQWGLLLAAPLAVLALATIPHWIVINRQTALISFAAITPYLIVVSAYKVWWGEWGPAARYLVPVIPYAAATLGAWLTQASLSRRLTVVSLWIPGMIVTMLGYQRPRDFYHQPNGINNLIDRVDNILHININRVTVPFQPYAIDPFVTRFWISIFASVCIVALMYLVSRKQIVSLLNLLRQDIRHVFWQNTPN